MGVLVGWEAPSGAAWLRAELIGAGLDIADGCPAEAGVIVTVVTAAGSELARVEQLATDFPDRVLVLGDVDSYSRHWALLRAGAAAVFAEASQSVPAVVARTRRWELIDELARQACATLVGTSPVLRRTLRSVVEAARFTRGPILLTGPSGTGKELLARVIHDIRHSSGDVAGQLVLLDCSTVVPDLAGSEFFGHERGAFTGAAGSRDGAFARADGGTLFLDEIGELPLPLQPELLRAVQEGAYKRVGGNVWRRASFGLVCATNRDLYAEVAAGRFREDLLYRVAAWHCRVPTLAERRGDVLPLARYFFTEAGVRADLSEDVCRYLTSRRYPGNVRELRQLVYRMAARHAGDGPVSLGDVPIEDRPAPIGGHAWPDDALQHSVQDALTARVPLETIKRTVADLAVSLALERTDGHTQDAAALLDVSPRAVQQRRAKRRVP